jgi:hypothetical protein
MTAHKRALALVVCTALLLTLPLTGIASAKTKNGCKALTTEQVNAGLGDIAGGEAADGTANEFEGYTSCTWVLGTATVFIGLSKVNKENKGDFKKRSKADGVEKVKGLKKAFIEPVESGGGATVTFIDGKTFVNLQYYTMDAAVDVDTVKDALISLAKKAAKKI